MEICNKGLINIKDVRRILLEFLKDGLITYEEVPLEKEKSTKLVYTYDVEKVKFKIMNSFYKVEYWFVDV